MKIGIIVDSSCGLTEQEAKNKGWIYLPLIANIDGKDYRDGVDLSYNEYYNMIDINSEVRTSATAPGIILEAFENAANNYDKVIVYGLSTNLSSQTQNLQAIAKDFKNIYVIESKSIGKAIVRDIEEGLKEKEFEVIFNKISNLSKNTSALVFCKSLKWLVKGGRVSPAVAKMANLLKIVPIIELKDGRLEKYGKGRSFIKTVIKNAKLIKETYPNQEIHIYCGKFEGIETLTAEVKAIIGEVIVSILPPVIVNHTGPEIMGILIRG